MDSCLVFGARPGRTRLTWEDLFTGEPLAWLEAHLKRHARERPLILFIHHGVHSDQPHACKQNLLWDVLNWRPADLLLACAGHAHENARQQWGATTMLWTGVLSSVRANHVDLPPGFRMVWLQGREVETEWVPVTDVPP